MVKKLFKYEWIAYTRTLLPVYLVLLGIAALGRFVQFFESGSSAYTIVNTSSIIAYGVALISCFGFAWAFAVIRFYKNLFTGEGYLSFTLPVTPTQHIFTKGVAAVLFSAISFVVALVSACIITAGDVLHELCKAGVYLFRRIPDEYKADVVFYGIEIILDLLIASAAGFLLFYTCIAIGQTFRKNRILGAIGVYFIYYIITQILGTVLIVVLSVLAHTPFMNWVEDFIYFHPQECIHIFLCGIGVFYAGIGVLGFFITKRVMHKRLNLE